MDIWKFQKNEDGTSVGWNDPGLLHFKEEGIKNLSKETIQNSTDNPAKGENCPVKVVFSLEKRERDEIPGVQSLQEAIEQCSQSIEGETGSSKQEIDKALWVIQQKQVQVLTIADYGTTGMGDRFYTFLKTMGTSSDDHNRTGSHGMGKNAPIGTSAIRTILVSSVWKDSSSGDLVDAVQGKTVLKGRKTSDGQMYKNEGFWGKEYGSVRANEHKYSWINRERNEIGTSIHVLGFETGSQPKKPHSWVYQIIAAAITTYFANFSKGQLVLEIRYSEGKSVVVDQNSIEDWFKKDYDELDDTDQEALQHAYLYYQLLTSKNEDIKDESFDLDHLGECNLRLRISDTHELPQKICILRDGINITDSLSTFYKQRIKRLMDFVGIFECKTDAGKNFIRRMEPPQHNSIHYGQLAKDEHDTGKKVLKELGDKLKQLVNEHAKYPETDETRIDALSEFLQDIDEDGVAGIETDPNGNWGVPSPKPLPKPKKSPKIIPGRYLPDGPPKPDPVPPAPNPGPGPKPGPGPTTKKIYEDLALSEERVIKISNQKVRLFFKSTTPANNCNLHLSEMGSDTTEGIPIKATNIGECSEGKVIMDVDSNQRICLEVELDRPLLGSVQINLLRIQQMEDE